MSGKSIYWLASYPRSGNTGLRFMIEHYYTSKLPLDRTRVINGDNVKNFYDTVSGWELGTTDDFIPFYGVLRPAALVQLINFWTTQEEDLTKHILLKSHGANYFISEVPHFPAIISAGAVVLVRDPRDVVISYSKYLGIPYKDGAKLMCDQSTKMIGDGLAPTILSSWNTYHTLWASESRFPVTFIKYEDMLEDPESTLTHVLETTGEENIDQDKVKKAVEACELNQLQKLEKTKGFNDHKGKGTFFRKGKSEVWKKELPIKFVRQIEKDCEKIMKDFGYE